MFMEYAQKYHDKIQFAHCDFDTEAGLNTKFRVRHILDTLVEPKKVEAFDEFVQKALKEI